MHRRVQTTAKTNIMFDAAILHNAIRVALLVGTLLNVVNHVDVLFSVQQWPLASMALNYIIPFLVSLYSGDKICRVKAPSKKEQANESS